MPRARAPQNHQTEPKPPLEEERPQPDRYLSDGFPNPKAMNVWDYMQELTDEQWKEHIGYLYRTSPTTMRVQGKAAFLLKFASPITEEQIAEQYGGRAYTLILKRGKEKAYEERFGIEAPPKFQDSETPEGAAAEEKKESAATDGVLQQLIDVLKGELAEAKAQGRETNPMGALKTSLELMQHASKSSIDFALKQAPQQPNIAEMISAISELQKLGGGGGGGGLVETLKVLRELGVLGNQQQRNPLGQMRDLLGLIKELKEESGGGGGEGSVWTELARSVGPHLAGMIENLRGSMGDFRAAQEAQTARTMIGKGYQVRAPQGAAPLPGAAGAAPAIPSVGARAPSSGAPLPGPVLVQPAPSSPPYGGAAESPPDNQAIASFMQDFIKSRIVKFLKDGESGEEAAGWADDTDPFFAEQLAQVIKENPAALAHDAIFSQVIQHPDLRRFAEDYVAYFEKAEEPEPVPTGAPTG